MLVNYDDFCGLESPTSSRKSRPGSVDNTPWLCLSSLLLPFMIWRLFSFLCNDLFGAHLHFTCL
jgi:hypothetical protein